ncbi:hypothetical protein STEG23_030717 [Scotinomys teguina]
MHLKSVYILCLNVFHASFMHSSSYLKLELTRNYAFNNQLSFLYHSTCVSDIYSFQMIDRNEVDVEKTGEKWEMDIGESLDAHKPIGEIYAALQEATKKHCFKPDRKKQDVNMEDVL